MGEEMSKKIKPNLWSGRLGRRNQVKAVDCIKCGKSIATIKEPPMCEGCGWKA